MRHPLVVLTLLISLGIAPAAYAGAAGDTPTTTPVAVEAPTDTVSAAVSNLECASPAIKKPDCGVEPQQAGDRGGALQYTVWVLLVVGLILVFTVVFRSARRTNLARRAEVGDRQWS